MLPEAEFAFLDEVFQGSTAILNTLLGILNERVFRRGHTIVRCPLRVCVGASNALPEDDSLAAFSDRFLVRIFVDPVPDPRLEELLEAGWHLSDSGSGTEVPFSPATLADMDVLSAATRRADLTWVRPHLAHAIRQLRAAGILLSDRRAVRAQRLVAAAAAIAGRARPTDADLWPLILAVPTREQQSLARECLARPAGAERELDAPRRGRGGLARAARPRRPHRRRRPRGAPPPPAGPRGARRLVPAPRGHRPRDRRRFRPREHAARARRSPHPHHRSPEGGPGRRTGPVAALLSPMKEDVALPVAWGPRRVPLEPVGVAVAGGGGAVAGAAPARPYGRGARQAERRGRGGPAHPAWRRRGAALGRRRGLPRPRPAAPRRSSFPPLASRRSPSTCWSARSRTAPCASRRRRRSRSCSIPRCSPRRWRPGRSCASGLQAWLAAAPEADA